VGRDKDDVDTEPMAGGHKGQYISNKTKGEKEDKGRAFLSYSKQDLQPVGEQKGTLPDVQSTLPGAK
jgi:hypothetical protein